MTTKRDPDTEPVVAVCGNEARVYGPAPFDTKTGKKLPRALWSVKVFPHHGAALLYAREFEEKAA